MRVPLPPPWQKEENPGGPAGKCRGGREAVALARGEWLSRMEETFQNTICLPPLPSLQSLPYLLDQCKVNFFARNCAEWPIWCIQIYEGVPLKRRLHPWRILSTCWASPFSPCQERASRNGRLPCLALPCLRVLTGVFFSLQWGGEGGGGGDGEGIWAPKKLPPLQTPQSPSPGKEQPSLPP